MLLFCRDREETLIKNLWESWTSYISMFSKLLLTWILRAGSKKSVIQSLPVLSYRKCSDQKYVVRYVSDNSLKNRLSSDSVARRVLAGRKGTEEKKHVLGPTGLEVGHVLWYVSLEEPRNRVLLTSLNDKAMNEDRFTYLQWKSGSGGTERMWLV